VGSNPVTSGGTAVATKKIKISSGNCQTIFSGATALSATYKINCVAQWNCLHLRNRQSGLLGSYPASTKGSIKIVAKLCALFWLMLLNVKWRLWTRKIRNKIFWPKMPLFINNITCRYAGTA
jgi:hypothetical protein